MALTRTTLHGCVALCVMVCGAQTLHALPRDANGWTIFTPSTDTVKIYVSSSVGDDAFNGLMPDPDGAGGGPKRTVAEGLKLLRPQQPDWLLLRRGDTWTDPGSLNVPRKLDKSLGFDIGGGRAANEPQIVAAYGSSPERPLLRTSTPVVNIVGNGVTRFVAWVGLHCYAFTRDPASPDFATTLSATGYVIPRHNPNGFRILGHASGWTGDFLIEDCVIDFFDGGITCQTNMRNMAVRRCIITNSYNGQFPDSNNGYPDRSQGIFCIDTLGLLVEECLLYHNGWNATMGYGMSIYSHNMYLSTDINPCRVIGNIACGAGSNGGQMRAGGIADNNLFLRNPIGLFLSGDPNGAEEGINTCINNVFVEANDIVNNQGEVARRGVGLDIKRKPLGFYKGNICLDRLSARQQAGIRCTEDPITTAPPILVTGNIVRNWNNASGQGIEVPPELVNDFILTGNVVDGKDQAGNPVVFPDPNRNMDTYMNHLGIGGGWEEFIRRAAARPWGQWPREFSADGFNDYIREGFGMDQKTAASYVLIH